MSLEFEKLLQPLNDMAQASAARLRHRQAIIDELLQVLDQHAEAWEAIDAALAMAGELADPKHYRSARPIDHREPISSRIDPTNPPEQATIIAADGSQILPDRHAAHLYYVINIGGIVYYHGDGRPPEPFSDPMLGFPVDDREAVDFPGASEVSIERDLQEIATLARKAWEHRHDSHHVLALLDQRLLYWPIGGPDAQPNEQVKRWLGAMTQIHDSDALLAGYIDRPMTSGVVTLLASLVAMNKAHFEWKSLGKSGTAAGLRDASLFSQILEPGQRSKIFAGVSPPNQRFAESDPANEICFFYMNPGLTGRQIARVDIPRWVAIDDAAVSAVHAFIVDQCRILGDYPYVIARADEMAVIGHQDHQELDLMIALAMQRFGLQDQTTAKQSSKEIARGGKTRHGGL